jgi:hypothetical protein
MTEAGRALLRDHFVINEHTDPRTRIADDLTAPQFVAAIEAIEREAYEQAKADAIAAVERLPSWDEFDDGQVDVGLKAVLVAIRDLHP